MASRLQQLAILMMVMNVMRLTTLLNDSPSSVWYKFVVGSIQNMSNQYN